MVEGAVKESWEDECKRRIESWRDQLKGLVDSPAAPMIEALQLFKAAVDTQLALADLKIKARQAGHAKQIIWLPLVGAVIGLVGGLLGVLLGTWLKTR